MHVYIWAGLKSHSEGQHDYPQFLADWSKILTEHGAVVDGALHPPGSGDLEHADVVVIYKGDAGYMSDSQKATLEAFIKLLRTKIDEGREEKLIQTIRGFGYRLHGGRDS